MSRSNTTGKKGDVVLDQHTDFTPLNNPVKSENRGSTHVEFEDGARSVHKSVPRDLKDYFPLPKDTVYVAHQSGHETEVTKPAKMGKKALSFAASGLEHSRTTVNSSEADDAGSADRSPPIPPDEVNVPQQAGRRKQTEEAIKMGRRHGRRLNETRGEA